MEERNRRLSSIIPWLNAMIADPAADRLPRDLMFNAA
jgi:hypothetical protein